MQPYAGATYSAGEIVAFFAQMALGGPAVGRGLVTWTIRTGCHQLVFWLLLPGVRSDWLHGPYLHGPYWLSSIEYVLVVTPGGGCQIGYIHTWTIILAALSSIIE